MELVCGQQHCEVTCAIYFKKNSYFDLKSKQKNLNERISQR